MCFLWLLLAFCSFFASSHAKLDRILSDRPKAIHDTAWLIPDLHLVHHQHDWSNKRRATGSPPIRARFPGPPPPPVHDEPWNEGGIRPRDEDWEVIQPTPDDIVFGERETPFRENFSHRLTLSSLRDHRPAPFESRPAPFEPRPAPFEPRPAPFEPRPAPFEPRPAPFEPRPAPFEPRPPPFEAKPVSAPRRYRPRIHRPRPFPALSPEPIEILKGPASRPFHSGFRRTPGFVSNSLEGLPSSPVPTGFRLPEADLELGALFPGNPQVSARRPLGFASSDQSTKALPPPPPRRTEPYIEEYGPAGPYEFSWSVLDDYTGNDYSHQQSSDGEVTKGEYRVLLPDGRTQIVSFIADDTGYHADVAYEGIATYPEYKPDLFHRKKRQYHLNKKQVMSEETKEPQALL